MQRINVTAQGDHGTKLVGWFDRSTAESWGEDTRWDGSNHVSIATGSQWDHEQLYQTAGGRFVLYRWSQWQGRGTFTSSLASTLPASGSCSTDTTT